MKINETAKLVHENARSKGFYEGEKNTGEMLMLIVTEVAEACEADRKSRSANIKLFEEESRCQLTHGEKEAFDFAFKMHVKDTFEDELADIVIRVMDLAAFKNIDLEKHIELKMKHNAFRGHKHGKNY